MSDFLHRRRGFSIPSPWVVRFADLVATGGPVLDLACGRGRHARLFLERGHPVTVLDRDVSHLADLKDREDVEIVAADLEDGGPWPLPDRQFAGIVVTNYLHRPLFPHILTALATDGVLLYETFAQGNERFHHMRNPHFLLKPGELLDLTRDKLLVLAYEHGRVEKPNPSVLQRICAIKSDPAAIVPLPPAPGET